jgi:glycosyltransferase involved in cell wall biosynthesis
VALFSPALFPLRRSLSLLRRGLVGGSARGWSATCRYALDRVRARRGEAPAPADSVATAAAIEVDPPYVLLVDVAVPDPDQDSGSLRLSNLMRVLRSAGYRLVFIPDDFRGRGPAADALRAMGVAVPVLSGARDAAAWVRRRRSGLAAAILCRHHTAGHWLPLLRAVAPGTRIVFDTVDLHHLREQREAEHAGSRLMRRVADSTRRRELDLVRRADTTWVVSPVERELLSGACPGADVRVLSNIIDEDTAGADYATRRDLLFVGGLRHPPNRDAVEWLASEIFPRIREQLPQVELHLVGSPGPEPLAALAPGSGIHAHGHVADLGPYLDRCRIALAPLRFGAGVKGKINLSMAHGQPVVATGCAIEGMHLRHGHDVLAADDAAGFADAVVRLYRDGTLWQDLAARGRANVRTHFSPRAALAVASETLGAPPRH